MSFVNKADQSGSINNFSVPHKGKVLKNDDPLKLGRVKCFVKGLFEDTSNDCEGLPWCFPQVFGGLGGRPDSSSFMVPELDSELTIIFPFKDIYTPFYIGFWRSELTSSSSIFKEDYPETYGFTDKNEFLRINKKKPTIEFFRKVGDWIKISDDGTWQINIPSNCVINVGANLQVNVKNTSTLVAGVNITSHAGQDQNVTAGRGFGGSSGGGFNMKCGGNMNAVVSGVCAFDAKTIHHNSAVSSYTDTSGGDKSELASKVSEMQSTIQSLQQEIETLKQLVAKNLPKIGK